MQDKKDCICAYCVNNSVRKVELSPEKVREKALEVHSFLKPFIYKGGTPEDHITALAAIVLLAESIKESFMVQHVLGELTVSQTKQ